MFPEYDSLSLEEITKILLFERKPYKHIVYLLKRRSMFMSTTLKFQCSHFRRVHALCKSSSCTFSYLATGKDMISFQNGALDHSCADSIKSFEKRSSIPSSLFATIVKDYVKSDEKNSISGNCIHFTFLSLNLYHLRDTESCPKNGYYGALKRTSHESKKDCFDRISTWNIGRPIC